MKSDGYSYFDLIDTISSADKPALGKQFDSKLLLTFQKSSMLHGFRISKERTEDLSVTTYFTSKNRIQAGATVTLESGVVATVYDTLIIDTSSTLILESGSQLVVKEGGIVYIDSNAVINLQGGAIVNESSDTSMIVYSEHGLQGTGTVQNARILWKKSADILEGDHLTFQGGGHFSFDCDSQNEQNIHCSGVLSFSGDSLPYVFGCIDQLLISGEGSLSAAAGTTLQNLPDIDVESAATIHSNGTAEDSCTWLFTARAELNVYGTINAEYSSFEGKEESIQWDGILVAGDLSHIHLTHCLITDIFSDDVTFGSGIHLYGSNNQENSVTLCRIVRPWDQHSKFGNAIFLQPNSVRSSLRAEYNCLYEHWWCGISNVGSDVNLKGDTIYDNGVGLTQSYQADGRAFDNCIHSQQHLGIWMNNSYFYLGDASLPMGDGYGYNRIAENDTAQIYLMNHSFLVGGIRIDDIPYASFDHISHQSDARKKNHL